MNVGGTSDTDGLRILPQGKRNKKWMVALGGIVVVFVVLAGYDLIASGGTLTGSAASPSASQSHGALALTSPAPVVRSTAAGSSAATLPALPTATTPSTAPVQELSAASAAAFGPGGTSDGDNPATATRVISGDDILPWSTQWYTTPNFGNLQPGTGLLLDMGQPVSLSNVRLELGDAVGADVQLRVGETASLPADMSMVASASDVGGTVHLSLSSPVRARYVLIWFTQLPPDGAGTYQVSVYRVTVDGQN